MNDMHSIGLDAYKKTISYRVRRYGQRVMENFLPDSGSEE